jgi:septation ring formation regulator EzrA
VNTPIRAWREVFKNALLLDKIIQYSNNYGQVKAKWQDVKRKDLEAFICVVIFVSAIQKRKDKPSN